MKTKLSFSLLELMLCIAIVAVLAGITSPRAMAQVAAQDVTALALSSTNALNASSTNSITTAAFTANSHTGFGVVPTFVADGASTGNVTFYFQASKDGTNWSTTYPFTATFAANGTNSVVGYYNMPASSATNGVANARYIRLGQVINSATNAVTIGDLSVTKTRK